MNQMCFVKRPHPSFTYLLVNGTSPVGFLRGEDCIQFDTARLRVQDVNGHWKITDGQMWLLDFANKANEARTALSIIRKYGFSHQCFVGRPGALFKYWRK